MKVYVVTTGERNKDYHILGVTLDRKDAESYVNAMNEIMNRYGERFCVEEYDTDNFKYVKADKAPYIVEFCPNGEHFIFRCDNNHSDVNTVHKYSDGRYQVKVYAETEICSVEIASEKVAEYKARKEGIT